MRTRAIPYDADFEDPGDFERQAAAEGRLRPQVWETYKPDSAVFRGDAKGAIAPAGWNCPLEPLPGCDAPARMPVLRMISEDANSAHEFLQAGTFTPLIDQNGSFVRYEMRVNRDEFEFIDANKLWDSNHHTADVDFQPVGSIEEKTVGPSAGNCSPAHSTKTHPRAVSRRRPSRRRSKRRTSWPFHSRPTSSLSSARMAAYDVKLDSYEWMTLDPKFQP